MHQAFRGGVFAGLVHLALLAVVPAGVAGQALQGRLMESEHQRTISGGVVQLVDSAGRLLVSAVTSSTGSFVLRTPGPGSYRLRAFAVGFKPGESALQRHEGGRDVVPDLLLVRTAVVLADVVVRARKGGCANAGAGDPVFESLLEGAATSLKIMETMLAEGAASFETEVIAFRNVGGVTSADTTRGRLLSWPFVSLDPDSLQMVGFHRHITNSMASIDIYYAPDARVLFAPWFLATHCFTLQPVRTGDRSITIGFKPRQKSKLVDISGELVLDAELLTPVTLSYRHLQLPRGLPDNSSGGEVKFMALGDGLWLPINWRMWAPIASSLHSPDQTRAFGRAERNGRVVKLLPATPKETPP